MPNAAKTFRRSPPQPRVDRRPTARQRGYDEKWKRLSIAYRKQHPHCEDCLERGRMVDTNLVDHVVPFESYDDPKRLDWNNLRSLCRSCHGTKTWRDKLMGLCRRWAKSALIFAIVMLAFAAWVGGIKSLAPGRPNRVFQRTYFLSKF